jgi:5-methyltetrahydrofolate corrinoid/iron sulfur protein methyltransferase
MLIVADDMQSLKPEISGAVARRDPAPIRRLVRQCLQQGAEALDLNVGPLPRDGAATMRFWVETVQSETGVPLFLDTPNPEALEAGLTVARSPTVINGVSLEPHKLDRILPLAKRFCTDLVGFLLTPQGAVPATLHERLEVAQRLCREVEDAGIALDRLIIDPVVAPVTWDNGVGRNRDLVSLLGHLESLVGQPVRTIAGISNLSAGAPDRSSRQRLERVFVPMLAASGLGMALVSVFNPGTVAAVRISRMLRGERVFAWAALDDDD